MGSAARVEMTAKRRIRNLHRVKPGIRHIAASRGFNETLSVAWCGATKDETNIVQLAPRYATCNECKKVRAEHIARAQKAA